MDTTAPTLKDLERNARCLSWAISESKDPDQRARLDAERKAIVAHIHAEVAKSRAPKAEPATKPTPAHPASHLRLRNIGRSRYYGTVVDIEVRGVEKAYARYAKPKARSYETSAWPLGDQSKGPLDGKTLRMGMLYDRDEWAVLAGDPVLFEEALAAGLVDLSPLAGSDGCDLPGVPPMSAIESMTVVQPTRPAAGESWTCMSCDTKHSRAPGIAGCGKCGKCGSLGMRYERAVHLVKGDLLEGFEVLEVAPERIQVRSLVTTYTLTRTPATGWTASDDHHRDGRSNLRVVGGVGRSDWLALLAEVAGFERVRGAA